jgi:hypothetical protein
MMRAGTLGLLMIGSLAAGPGAWAQTAPSPMPAAPPAMSPAPRAVAPAVAAPQPMTTPAALVEAATLEAGANSFTEGQAKGRFEEQGFTGIQGLAKDDAGFWRARGMRNGAITEIAMDFHGHIAAGPGVAMLRSGSTRPASPATR